MTNLSDYEISQFPWILSPVLHTAFDSIRLILLLIAFIVNILVLKTLLNTNHHANTKFLLLHDLITNEICIGIILGGGA